MNEFKLFSVILTGLPQNKLTVYFRVLNLSLSWPAQTILINKRSLRIRMGQKHFQNYSVLLPVKHESVTLSACIPACLSACLPVYLPANLLAQWEVNSHKVSFMFGPAWSFGKNSQLTVVDCDTLHWNLF